MSNEWKEVKLGDVASYVLNKVETIDITLENYVSTENLQPNIGGLELSNSLPNAKRVTKFKKIIFLSQI